MPEIEKGESKSHYISRCRAYYIKRGLTEKHALGKCYGMWDSKHGLTDSEGNKEFTLEVPLISTSVKKEFIDENETVENKQYDVSSNKKHAVAIIGDRFYKGDFMPAAELEKVYKLWEGSLHDINHFGTTYPTGLFATQNILYFVGYNNNVKYDSKTKAVSMDINIVNETKYADAWKGYIALCEKSGNTPNVSITFHAKTKMVKASELPKSVNYADYGYGKDDYVSYIYDIQPKALSTVLFGACNDKCGCGITHQNDDNELTDEEKAQKLALIKWLKENE